MPDGLVLFLIQVETKVGLETSHTIGRFHHILGDIEGDIAFRAICQTRVDIVEVEVGTKFATDEPTDIGAERTIDGDATGTVVPTPF